MRPPLPEGFDQVRLEVLTGMARLAGPAENMARMATFTEPYYRGEFDAGARAAAGPRPARRLTAAPAPAGQGVRRMATRGSRSRPRAASSARTRRNPAPISSSATTPKPHRS